MPKKKKSQLGFPFTGPRYSGNLEDCYMLQCPACGFSEPLGSWESIGACEGNVFCANCAEEVCVESGEPAEPCGECEFCD